jgi:hypothetical protein
MLFGGGELLGLGIVFVFGMFMLFCATWVLIGGWLDCK